MSVGKVKNLLEKNGFNHKKIVELSGDISTRKYFEVEIDGKIQIACLNEKDNKKHNELYYYWYEKYLEHNIRVPAIIHFENGFNLQEKIHETIPNPAP